MYLVRHTSRLRTGFTSSMPPHVSVVSASELALALEGLIQSVTALHGDRFDPRSFEVRIAKARWRAGMTFLPEPLAVRPFVWPALARIIREPTAGTLTPTLSLTREREPGVPPSPPPRGRGQGEGERTTQSVCS
jgi:hypothetical protein